MDLLYSILIMYTPYIIDRSIFIYSYLSIHLDIRSLIFKIDLV